jgi:hypothetical protein
MTHRWVVFGVFIVLVGLVAWYKNPEASPAPPGYVAVREIQMNTRLSRDHWSFNKGATPLDSWGLPKPEELLGKYARVRISGGQVIRPDQLADVPMLRPKAGTVLLGFESTDLGPAASLLNAGSEVYVCDKENLSCPGGPYLVEAILGKPESPFAIIRATLAQDAELRKISKPKLRLAELP